MLQAEPRDRIEKPFFPACRKKMVFLSCHGAKPHMMSAKREEWKRRGEKAERAVMSAKREEWKRRGEKAERAVMSAKRE
ncbi:MAG: hypothetical protein J1F22_08430, partial [Lachnospiraceae bacterium]|nr:hypothetical protein [Lachnospiraceae bacterium]